MNTTIRARGFRRKQGPEQQGRWSRQSCNINSQYLAAWNSKRGLACVAHPGVAAARSHPASTERLLGFQQRCRALYRPRYSTSSSTTCTTNPTRSNPVASFPNRGFRGRENTSSLTSNSTPRYHTSSCGRKHSRILPTLPPTTPAVSLSVESRLSPPRIRMQMVGSAPSTTLNACAWIALEKMIFGPPLFRSTGYHPLSNHSA